MLLSMAQFFTEILIPILQVLFIIAIGFLTWVLFKTACVLESIEDDIHTIKKFIDRIDLID